MAWPSLRLSLCPTTLLHPDSFACVPQACSCSGSGAGLERGALPGQRLGARLLLTSHGQVEQPTLERSNSG